MRLQFTKLMTACLIVPCLLLLSACTTESMLGDDIARQAKAGNADHEAALPEATRNLLYVTDRAPVEAADGTVSYGAQRARSVSFGTVLLAAEKQSGQKAIAGNDVPLHVVSTRQIGKFPPSPYSVEITAKGPRRTPAVVTAHEQAAASLQAEISRRLAVAKRKEVVVFIHGYNNTFDDAATSTGDICRTLSSEFVCIVLTWPAGGSGVFAGYNIDRESGEFAVADLKRVIRIISQTKGLERLHLIAHSRGTDVLLSAVQQLGIEAYASRSSPSLSYKIANVILFAPDIDLDVAETKLFGVVSDPDMSFGGKSAPAAAFPPLGALHLTVYSSPNDKAIALSSWLFGSVVRLGRLSSDSLKEKNVGANSLWENSELSGIADFIEYDGGAGFIGHSYFLSDRLVNRDMVALIRDRLKAGDPGRPLVEVKRPFWRVAEAGKLTN
ncbi:alpha/beta hydrolase [Rhizobium sp. PL01]|uniref:alpha/beta hydrolase n=1 Tax=Rhizobium sp. PL01 TaxID=3085631 RepID=UPI00298260B8|nr:alpha/beta hydrolase [Rhizobium sp. PL01]MDW5315499.1 alpha/beta hydrolase [Rhizobium sp. PL01]